jgi:carbonic anhydrase/acetyltransferase-like protein (isoleucine patch superfamily)
LRKWQMANGNGQRDSALSDIPRLAFKERCPARKVPVAPGAAVSSMVTLRGVGFLRPVRLESCMAHYRIYNKQPQVASTAFVASEATLIGEVIIGERASVWPGCVIRGDNEPIRIGEGSNVQEGAVLHTDFGFPLTIAERVTIGHQAMLHGCTVGAGSLIGIQAVVMNGAVIGEGCIVGAGTLVTEGKRFPPRSLIMGVPGKVVRELGDADQAKLMQAADDYIEKGRSYLADLVRVD